MLLAFRAENARSFRDPIELSLLATRVSDREVVREIPWREGGQPVDVLPCAAVFGANASGKSNLLQAMVDMRNVVLRSFQKSSPGARLNTWPFRLGDDDAELPVTYEVDLVLGGVRHEYGFELNEERILSEWAHRWPKGRSSLIFRRDGDEVELPAGQRAVARATLGILRSNALFLSTAAATNHHSLLPLFEWFQRNLVFADVNSRTARQALTSELLDKDLLGRQALALLQEADLGITGVRKKELPADIRDHLMRAAEALRGGVEPDEPEFEVRFDDFDVHLTHRAGSREVELRSAEESRGTLVWFGLIGPVLEALRDGSVLLADELDASLHPVLVNVIVALFQSKRSNPRRAQLIFNSHDITLISDAGHSTIGRDQIWFTEKGNDGACRLYALADLQPRKGEALARRYMAGRYGATPIVSVGQLEEIAHPGDETDGDSD